MSKFKVGEKVRTKIQLWSDEIGKIIKVVPANDQFTANAYIVWFGSSDYDRFILEHELYSVQQPDCPLVEAVKEPKLEANGGTKYDGDKVDISLVSSRSIIKIAQVLTYGKSKYSANNWRKGMAWTRLSSAVLRHIFAWLGGETKDPETGISHLAHAACGLIFLLEFEDTHPELDDRYKDESA